MKKIGMKWSLSLVAVAGLLAACSSSSTPGASKAASNSSNINLIYVGNAPPSNEFWAIIVRGFSQAGHDLHVNTTYRGTPGDVTTPEAEIQLIQSAVAQHPSGLIIADPTPSSLDPAIKAAVASGIPVIIANAGLGLATQLGALTYIGNDEQGDGALMGQQLNKAGCRSALTFSTTPGTVPLWDQRAQGFVSAFKGTVTRVNLPITVINGSSSAMTGNWETELTKNPSIDCAISLAGTTTAEMLAARTSLGSRGTKMHWFALDCISGVYQAVQQHALTSCADQQQFMQGYLPVVFLYNYIRWGILPGSDFIPTGPRLVTWGNVSKFASSYGTSVAG